MGRADLVRLIVLAAIWGGSFLFLRVAVPVLGPTQVIAYRVGLAAMLLLAIAVLRGRRMDASARMLPARSRFRRYVVPRGGWIRALGLPGGAWQHYLIHTFATVLHSLGIPAPHLLAWLTTAVELIGGLAVLAGAFVPLASVPLAVVLLTALLTIHLPYGFFSVKLVEVTGTGTKFGTVGYEIILLYLAGLGTLAAGGAGRLSVDRWLSNRARHRMP